VPRAWSFVILRIRCPPVSTLFPYTTLFRSCLHHFIELARHSDLDIVSKRIDFLKSFSQIAWFGRSYDPNILGGIPDIYEAEVGRSEEHTSELQSRFDLVCRLLLEKKNQPSS